MKDSRRNFIRTVSYSSIGFLNLPLSGFRTSNLAEDSNEPKNSLYRIFQNPPGAAKPFVRWWWNGNLIEEKEIKRQLDLLEDAGIGGVEINPIRFPGEDKLGIQELTWLSKEWLQMVKFAVEEAKKRDITCDIIVGSGWPFGGEFLEKDEQNQILSLNVNRYRLVGPATVRFSKQELLNRISSSVTGFKELYSVRMIPSYMEEFDGGIDLTNQFENDLLNIEVPYYVDQDLYVIAKITGRQSVTRGAPGASGPVLNHYKKSAVLKYLNRMSDAFHSEFKDLGAVFRAMFCDSMELGGHNWCDDMLEEFEKRRGYSLNPYIPFVLEYTGHEGNPVGAKLTGSALDEVNRVRYDYVITRQELFTERFLITYHNWCNANHVKSRVQAYGIGYHPLEASMIVDIPENETWLGNHNGLKDHHGFTSVNKFVASGSKLAGKKLVSCEEITNISQVFFASLEMIKIIGDQSNVSGVNHSVLHGYNYSPERAEFPGWVQFGTYFSERNTWWPFFKKWTSYKSRISALFQHANPRADIAIIHPLADKWSKYGAQFQPAFGWGERYPWYQYDLWYAIHQNGNTCDYISERIITDGDIGNSGITYNEHSYNTLIFMEVESIKPGTAQMLTKFAEAGGKLIFIKTAPHKSPGLKNHTENDAVVNQEIRGIIRNFPCTCKIVKAPEKDLLKWYQQIQSEFNIIPPVKLLHPSYDVSQVQYICDDKEIYFFINSSRSKTHSFQAEFKTGDKVPWIWNPESGDRNLYPFDEKKNVLNIVLSPAESKIIVFDSERKGHTLPLKKVNKSSAFILDGEWKVEFNHINGTHTCQTYDALFDFKDSPDYKNFAGKAIYTKIVNLDDAKPFEFVDLGKVHGISELVVNNVPVGTRWYGEHLYECKDQLKPGENIIRISVTTIVGNYCKSLDENKTCQNWTKNQSYESMGLIGPVLLYEQSLI
jgi:hypothetical protein